MKHTEEYINELLAKYITGEVMSDSEKNDIHEWIATHADEYNRLVKLISPKKAPEFGTAKAWAIIEEHIDKSATQKPAMSISTNRNKKRSVGMSVFYAAASVLVILVISISFFMSSKENNKEQLFANNTAEKMMIYLPDSSSVILYPDANVSYRTGGMNSAREVTLSGKAFFSVRKMHGRAFKVQSENLMVEVLGTSFLIDATKAESSSVYVKTGIVSVKSENSKVIIKANQKAELDNNTLKTGKIENPYEVFEEKPKILSFANAEIMEVVKKIEQATGVKIEVSKEIRKNKITSRIETADTEAIIVELAFLCNCKYETIEAGKHYRLY